MQIDTVIHWFRQDLRLSDNPSFTAATEQGPVAPIYILDDENSGEFAMGGASRWWLHHSLKSLDEALDGRLKLYRGDPLKIIPELCKKFSISSVYWNRCYEPWRIERDKKLKTLLKDEGIETKSFNASLLWEPWENLKDDGTPYKVFTPFYKRGCLLNSHPVREPASKPKKIELVERPLNSISLTKLNLISSIPWYKEMEKQWNIGEQGAQSTLKKFIKNGASDYKEGRNFPAKKSTSCLSPYLHFGEISPQQIWHQINRFKSDSNIDCFNSELGWREFSHSLLYHFPKLPSKNLQTKFDKYPWKTNAKWLKRWQQGQTGYPIVDAGMRELWQTGYMHNRVRMIVGSFLVKNLGIHWRQGEAWFWDCLVDADLANNSAGWQWIAGSGADAAPFFRIFNPITQGERFDPEGEYTRKYVPELSKLPDKFLFKPWTAPEEILSEAGIVLGSTYPKPIVDVKESRETALSAFKALSE